MNHWVSQKHLGGFIMQTSGIRRKFSWGGSFIQSRTVSFVFGRRCLRRHNLTSYSCFPNQRFGEVCTDQP